MKGGMIHDNAASITENKNKSTISTAIHRTYTNNKRKKSGVMTKWSVLILV